MKETGLREGTLKKVGPSLRSAFIFALIYEQLREKENKNQHFLLPHTVQDRKVKENSLMIDLKGEE